MRAFLLTASAVLTPALAQIFPERTIKILVPQSPGAGLDTLACVLADRLSPFFGQPLLGKNRPDAGTLVVAFSPCVAARRPTRASLLRRLPQ
jgi:tripartite-type tricarboxylate transporter receptor subunit TctC